MNTINFVRMFRTNNTFGVVYTVNGKHACSFIKASVATELIDAFGDRALTNRILVRALNWIEPVDSVCEWFRYALDSSQFMTKEMRIDVGDGIVSVRKAQERGRVWSFQYAPELGEVHARATREDETFRAVLARLMSHTTLASMRPVVKWNWRSVSR